MHDVPEGVFPQGLGRALAQKHVNSGLVIPVRAVQRRVVARAGTAANHARGRPTVQHLLLFVNAGIVEDVLDGIVLAVAIGAVLRGGLGGIATSVVVEVVREAGETNDM